MSQLRDSHTKSVAGSPDEDIEQATRLSIRDNSAGHIQVEDLLSKESEDPVLDFKMRLVNNAIDEIGFTRYHLKLFFLNGFGYAVDSLIILLQSIISAQAAAEFHPGYRNGLVIAVYVGMLTGALFWGLSADIIGRKYAFNLSLLISGIFTIVCGASPNWIVLGTFVCLAAFGAGGNLVLDTTVFLEYLPSSKSWLITLMAAWWGIGQLIAGLLAWAFLPNFSCDVTLDHCDPNKNKGWRYVWYTAGAIVLIMSILRVTIIRLQETPKFLLTEGKDEEVIKVLTDISVKYNRPCSLTYHQLLACNSTARPQHALSSSVVQREGWFPSIRSTFSEIRGHLKGLFSSPRIGLSTSLVWLSWATIGLAYPLYNAFLPAYLASRGASFGQTSPSIIWRNYALVNMCGIFGPVPAAFMSNSPFFWGRRGTMIIGALITCVFFFAYTQVRSPSQNLAFTCMISFFLNIYYGTLYAYTPEVLPSAHRGTGNGIAIAANRVMGIVSAVIATVANTSTSVPIFICAALYILMAIITFFFPFEPLGRRSS